MKFFNLRLDLLKKTITIALLGSIAATSVYADDLNANVVNNSIVNYSKKVEAAADTDPNSAIYAVKSMAADAADIQANGEKIARGLVLTNNGKVKIPNAVKPKDMYMKDQASAAQGLEKYRAERDGINKNIEKLQSEKKLGWKIKVAAEQAKLKSIKTKIDILKGIENGDKAYAEEKIASPRTALSICEANLLDVKANSNIATAIYIIKDLSDEKAVNAILTQFLDIINLGDIKVYDLDKLGSSWVVNAAVNAIAVAIGSEGVCLC